MKPIETIVKRKKRLKINFIGEQFQSGEFINLHTEEAELDEIVDELRMHILKEGYNISQLEVDRHIEIKYNE